MEPLHKLIGLTWALALSIGLALILTRLVLEAMFRMLFGARGAPLRVARLSSRGYPQTNVARVPPQAA